MPLPSAGLPDCSTGLAKRIFDNLRFDNPWKASQGGYAVGMLACPTMPNGYGYRVSAVTTGITAGSEPTWPLVLGNTVVDGGVTWIADTGPSVFPSARSPSYQYAYLAGDLDALRVLAYDTAKAVADEIGGGSDYCALSASTAAGQSIPNSTTTIVVYGTTVRDTDAAYNASTGRYTVPAGKGGDYQISATATWSSAPGASPYLSIFINAGERMRAYGRNATFDTMQIAGMLNLAAGDVVDIRITQTSGVAATLWNNATPNYFVLARLLGS